MVFLNKTYFRRLLSAWFFWVFFGVCYHTVWNSGIEGVFSGPFQSCCRAQLQQYGLHPLDATQLPFSGDSGEAGVHQDEERPVFDKF
jgi:hypothetical protein